MRLAKIIATLGPVSQDAETIRHLIQAGVNIIRLNFSHGNHEALDQTIQKILLIREELGLPVAILGDLQGPKFRIGELEEHKPIQLAQGATIRFEVGDQPGNQSLITTSLPQMIEELQVGNEVLLADGSIALQVIEKVSSHKLVCKVLTGGELGEKKGINVPGLRLSNISAMTEKDKADALFALEHDLEFLALSFVRSYQDILYLRQFIQEHLPPGKIAPQIIAKIEKPQALEEIDAIIETADAIMVARGDLGVELKPEKVPVTQKMLVNKANEAEKPVITATQILESMIHSATPTRAEVSDVANAVFDGSDALMLSGETAVGEHAVEAVQTMARIIEEAECHFRYWHHRVEVEEFIADTVSEKVLKFHQAIAQAACFAARKARTKAIVVISFSGSMARRISKMKPQLPIVALTPHPKVCRQLSLLWGVYPLTIAPADSAEKILLESEEAILERGILTPKDPIVLCAGKTHLTGITNSIKIYLLGDILQQHQ